MCVLEPRKTILVVDDTPENLTVMGELLQPHYQVRVASSGVRALTVAASEPRPDLILLDIMMPGMDGYETIARLRENEATRQIPVIFVTALDNVEDEAKGLDLGAVDYIGKPVGPAILLARVRAHLELKDARDRLRGQNLFLESEVARRVAEIQEIQEASYRALARLSRQKELILASAAEGIYGTDDRGVINFANPAAAAMLGFEVEELVGKDAHATLHHTRPDGTPCPENQCPLQTSLEAGVSVRGVEDSFRRKGGGILPVEFSSIPIVEDGEKRGVVVTFMDVSERLLYLAQLERQSNFDDLTGLPNRNLLTDRLNQAIVRCRQRNGLQAVLLINLDRFKEVNDNLGRHLGDQVLRETAKRMVSMATGADTLARLEGDDFVILLEGPEAEMAAELGQRVLAVLAEPFFIDGHEFFLSASIGISVYPKDGGDSEALLRNAGVALYKAKGDGGNGLRYYAVAMDQRSLERMELENGLRRALEKDEFELFYQPQLSLSSGEIIGAEALVRWRSPQRGLVPPGIFIPLAERNGLIIPLGEWVLRTACLQNKVWQDAGLPAISVAVNLSARQFVSQNLVEVATRILRETGLDPRFLELELTESAVMADADAFIHATEQLKGMAITLSIDDFGTGFSSLSYLKRFAIDRLKIDQSFVRDITHDPNSATITAAIIALAHSLKLKAIAEGVETEAQLGFLRGRGCDEMQGYYFAKPLPVEAFEALLREGRRLEFPAGTAAPEHTLLLVDDEAGILASLKRLLRRDGYKVLAAASGEEGLELMATYKVGVVISDARMPGMSGSEFLAKARVIHPDAVRIMLSGYTDFSAVAEAVNRGELFKFLTKPWSDEELLDTVRDAFRLHEARRASHAEGAAGP